MTDASSVIARLRELNAARTQGEWFAGPLQPEEDTGAPGGVSIGPIDLFEQYGARPDYTPERFSHHYEDQIAQVQGGEHDPVANAAAIVAALNAQEALLSCAEALAEFSAHYPYGINPYLDEAASNARAALAALAKVGGA